MNTAVPRPSSAPSAGPAPAPWASNVGYRNSAVSSPSRPTASRAAVNTPIAPSSTAADILPWRSPAMVRDARRIQNTIQVTNPTATIERIPANVSCASKLMLADV